MMESVRKWNGDKGSPNNICVSLELEKPKRHNLEFAELCDVLFISQIYAEEHLKATNMEDAVRKARQMIQNKEYEIDLRRIKLIKVHPISVPKLSVPGDRREQQLWTILKTQKSLPVLHFHPQSSGIPSELGTLSVPRQFTL